DFLLLAAAQPLLGALDYPVEEARSIGGCRGEPVVERIADGILDDARGFSRRQPVLGLTDEFGLADEDREERRSRSHDVVGGDGAGALVGTEFGVGLEALVEGSAKACLMRAALGSRDRVAIGADVAVAGEPGDRPFDSAVTGRLFGAAGEYRDDRPFVAELRFQIFLEAAREMEFGLFRNVRALDQFGCAAPANLNPAEQIGL